MLPKMMMMLIPTLCLLLPDARAQTPEDKGLSIAKEADRRDKGYGDFTADMQMSLKNKQGDESRRDIRIRNLEMESDGDKSLSYFDEPADVKGTTMLTFSHRTDDDDQWLYLPALKRVKRIASNNKSGAFMGSEFAFEDIGSQEVGKYTWKYLRDETLGGVPVFVLERYPVSPHSGYKRQIVWVDQTEYRTQQIEFYDRKDVLLKTLTFENYQRYLDKYWRAGQMRIVNHQTNKSTLLKWVNYKFRAGLVDSDFSQEALARAR
jgi:outer membrane lipoprotein-sorting protein